MKRSEAEKLINDWLDTTTVITGTTVLEFVENKLGMIPPEVMTVAPGGTFIDVNGTIHKFDSIDTFDNNWEPELSEEQISALFKAASIAANTGLPDDVEVFGLESLQSFCIDCGIETTPGKGSARCKECWDDKNGV